MTAIDIGCGMGYFSIGMAKVVGENGKIISVDIQQNMLDTQTKRAEKAGVANRITTILCNDKNIGINDKVDFALTFWMIHETPNELEFLKQIHSILKSPGKLLLAEPKIHVTCTEFKKTLSVAQELGFKLIESPKIAFSHTAVLEKK